MKKYEASGTIAATPETIWAILTDGSSYPEWDPSCDTIEGEIKLGNKIKAFSKLSPGRAFPVKVTVLDAPKRMQWSGGMPLGLFKGVRTFAITANGDSCEFVMNEVFSGPLLALFGGSIPDMTETFENFVAGLKARAESA